MKLFHSAANAFYPRLDISHPRWLCRLQPEAVIELWQTRCLGVLIEAMSRLVNQRFLCIK